MLKIVTVLKRPALNIYNGQDRALYPEHVYKIRDMCKQHISLDYDFFCLTDHLEMDCNIIPLQHNFPGWFSKMELYKIQGPVLYFDLDIVILNNLDSYISSLKDDCFYTTYDSKPTVDRINTSIMYWSNNMSFLYEGFLKLPFWEQWQVPRRYFSGDQRVVRYLLRTRKHNCNWAPLISGRRSEIISYKGLIKWNEIQKIKLARRGKTIDPSLMWKDKKIVWFHGYPRPWQQSIIPY